MIIIRKRSKEFSDTPSPPQESTQELTSRDLALENMKMQRQIMINQRTRQKLQAQERADRLRQISRAQRDEDKKDEVDAKNQIKIKKIEQESSVSEAKNIGLYKTKSRMPAPVPMKS